MEEIFFDERGTDMEYWDIYDSRKQVTGRKMVRNDWHMEPGDYHLTVLALIRDVQGKILITQRKADKEWAALKWEIPGGGVRAGETSQQAVLREVGKETGLHFAPEDARCIHTYRSDSPAERNNYFVDIYEFRGNFTRDQVKQDDFLHYHRIEGLLTMDIKKITIAGAGTKGIPWRTFLPGTGMK